MHGQATDSAGRGRAEISIAVTPIDGGASHSAVSGRDGQFQICNLERGQYRVTTHGMEFEDSAREVGFSGDEDAPIKLSLLHKGEPRPAAQQATQSSAQHDGLSSAANGSVHEFRAFGDAADSDFIPDAPVSSKKSPLHGQAYGQLGSAMVGGADVTMRDQLPISEYGVSLGGGPASSSFSVSFDQFGSNQQALLARLAAAQIKTGQEAFIPASQNVPTFSALSGRVDHRFSQRDSAYGRFTRDELHSNTIQPSADTSLPTSVKDFSITQHTAEAGNTITLSPTTMNQTTAQYIANVAQLPSGTPGPGMQSDLPTMRRNRIFEAANSVYHQAGGQTLRMGGDFIYNQMNISMMESSLGRATSGNSSLSQSDRNSGLYVLSEQKLLPNLLFTGGVRYDIDSRRGFKTDTNNLAPQAGLAWSPAKGTVIRGGIGFYYDQIPLPAIAGPSAPGQSANILDSARFVSRNGRPADELAGFTTMSPSIQNSYAQQASLQVDQQIGAKSVLSAESQFVRGVQLALPGLHPATLCASSAPCNTGNSFEGQQIGSGAISTYTGVTVAFTQQPTQWGNYKVAYTYSDAGGSGTDANLSQVDDRMRRVSLTGVLHTAGDPGSDVWQHFAHGLVLTGTGDFTNKSEFLGLNFFNINARLTKTLVWSQHFRFDALVETLNSLQRSNAAFAKSAAEMGDSVANVFTTYQRIASAQSPNGSQIGLRLVF